MRIVKMFVAVAIPFVLLGCPDSAKPDPAAAKPSASTTPAAAAPGASGAAAPAKSGGW